MRRTARANSRTFADRIMSTEAKHFETNALFPGGDGRCGIIYEDPYPNGMPKTVFKVEKDKAWTDKVHDALWNSKTMSVTSRISAKASEFEFSEWLVITDATSEVSGDFHLISGEIEFDERVSGEQREKGWVETRKLKKPQERVCVVDSALAVNLSESNVPGEPRTLEIDPDDVTPHGANEALYIGVGIRPTIDVIVETDYSLSTQSISKSYTDSETGIETDFVVDITQSEEFPFDRFFPEFDSSVAKSYAAHDIEIKFIHILPDGSSEVYINIRSALATGYAALLVYREYTTGDPVYEPFQYTSDYYPDVLLQETHQIELLGETIDAEILLIGFDDDEVEPQRIDRFELEFDFEATELYTYPE